MSETRPARPHEYDAILRFLAAAYRQPYDFFPLNYPGWWGEHTDFSRIWLSLTPDGIAGLVRVFPLRLVMGQTTITVGGIGSVATSPAARGQGHMHHTMRKAVVAMQGEFPLSVLWGDRHRYRPWGYEHGGSCPHLRITPRGLMKSNIVPADPIRFRGEPELLQRIQTLHSEWPFHRLREPHEDALSYARPDLITWLAGRTDPDGYVVYSSHNDQVKIMEFAGRPGTVLSLLAAVFAETGSSEVTLVFPAREVVAEAYWNVATGWSIQAGGMIKILDLGEVIDRFRPWLLEDHAATDSTLSTLPDPQVVDRIFGVGRTGAAPFFCWPLDHI